jgi:hypothetical protein
VAERRVVDAAAATARAGAAACTAELRRQEARREAVRGAAARLPRALISVCTAPTRAVFWVRIAEYKCDARCCHNDVSDANRRT